MASNLDLTDSAFEAVFSIFKRSFLLLIAVLWGAMIGASAAWLDRLLSGLFRSRVLEEESSVGTLYNFSQLSAVLEVFVGAALIIYACVTIVRGSVAIRHFLAAILGAGYLAITAAKLSDWSSTFLTWVVFALLLFHAWFLMRGWREKREAEFQAHLSQIQQENKARRSEQA